MKFWYTQPVFHIYDLFYWLKPPGVILETLPAFNKYINVFNIKTHAIAAIEEPLLEEVCDFIKAYYVQSPVATYAPDKNNIVDYLNESYVTVYQKDELLAVITARPLTITLKDQAPFSLYYVDNLCVHPDYRSKGIAPEMIQTHYYNLRVNNSKIKTCLFKREGTLTAIVPLTTYKTFCFNIAGLVSSALTTTNTIEIGENQLTLLLNFIYNQSKNYDCIIMPNISTILKMIKTENIYIYGILDLETNLLVAAYAFRRPKLFYDKEEAIECFFSLFDKNKMIRENYIHGFFISLTKCKEKLKTNILLIEDLAEASLLISYLTTELNVLFKSPTAFFLYNYACYTVPSSKALIFY